MTVAQAARFFEHHRALARVFATLEEVGLGYLPLGQPSTTLSGGEAQRIKLATELHRPATGRTLYLLDEPTTGLHFADVERLLHALQRLVDAGNTVLVVEHHLDVIKCADHLVDLGPEGGSAGGRIVGEGTPEAVARLDTPTGRALAALPELGGEGAALAELGGALAAEPAPAPLRRKRAARARELVVEGARLHNLAGVNARIPHGQMTVITGPSGSGKTSLAFDTIFAEGQRQYVESLSTYARRFLGRVERAPVDRIEGLAPAIAIDQRAASNNPRSTVATVTEIHDVLRLLWARVGQPHCPSCGRVVHGRSPSAAARWLSREVRGAGWLVADLRPVEAAAERRDALVEDGWTRLLVGGAELRLEEAAAVEALRAGATLVLDRLDPATAEASRLSEAIAEAYAMGEGRAAFVPRRGGAPVVLTARPTCPDHGDVLPDELTPRHFSFNSQLGACRACDGLGRTRQVDPERLFPRPELGFWEGMDGRVRSVLERSPRTAALVEVVLAFLGLDAARPCGAWDEVQRDALLNGLPHRFGIRWTQEWGRTVRNVEEEREWPGVVPILEGWSSRLEWLTVERPCRACGGGRLQAPLLAVSVGGVGLADFTRLTVDQALAAVAGWRFVGADAVIAERPVLELTRRLRFLADVGLGYLALDRAAETLSGGEAQRIRLASQLGVGLTGTLYVLDEPTIGLHPRDTARLLDTLAGLRDRGNTLVLVEHDPETIRRADHVIDLGPGAGAEGGRVVAAGTPAEIAAAPGSVTGPWLSGARAIAPRAARRAARAWLHLDGARGHNLKRADLALPTGVWVAVTGVSGSGKSSLVMDTLVPALREHLGTPAEPLPFAALRLGEAVDRLVVVDQSPLGRTPRSTPATYTKALDPIRKLFAETPGARARGWAPGRFSYNAPGGRCEACEGRGAILVEMHFLPDVWITCEACRGRRYDRETLEVRYRDHTIAEALSMRIDAAAELFLHHRGLHRQLQALVDVGLGYLCLGQPATTLSGGEAQRVKLAAELTSRRGHALYVLDEPTTGLHLSDVERLVGVLHALVDQGHTVVTIEHHVDVMRQADWIVDVGPEGGEAGGRIVAAGTPEQLAAADTPTGRALAGAAP
jgi:excinuclease ABC subunit A